MVKTPEERAALAARFMQRHRTVEGKAKAVPPVEVKAQPKVVPLNVSQPRIKKVAPAVGERSKRDLKVLREIEVLKRLKSKLLAALRPVGADGVKPPVLRRSLRKLRKDAVYDTHTGGYGPFDSELTEWRIHVVLLVSYQHSISVWSAMEHMAKTYGLKNAALQSSYERYATDEENEYRPYTNPSWGHKERMCYKEHANHLATRGIAFLDPYYPPEWPMDSQEKYMFRCLKVPEHKPWEARLTDVRTRSGCRKCGRLVTAEKQKAYWQAKRAAKATPENE